MPLPRRLTADTVKAWSRDLPYANKAVVAKESFELLKALQKENQPNNGERLAILTLMQTPVSLVLEHLQAQIISEHPKSALFLSLGEGYCTLLTDLYQQFRDSLPLAHRGFFSDHGASQAMMQQADCLGQQILFRALDHQPAPTRVWDRLQSLFIGSRVKNRAPFYRMIAFHLASTNRLPPRAIRDVFQLLQQLPVENLMDLNAATNVSNRVGFFLPTGHGVPSFGTIPVGARALNLSRLVRVLDDERSTPLDPLLRAELRNHWSIGTRSKDRRITPDNPLQTSARFGFSDILAHLREDKQEHDSQDTELRARLPNQTPSHFDRHTTELVDARIADISDNGCRLHTTTSNLRSGEIVCVNWGQGEKRIGTIVWFYKEGGERVCGIEWILEAPKAAQLRFDELETAYALLGHPPGSQRDILLYASHSGKPRSHCWIESNGEWLHYDLVVTDNKGLIEIAEPFPYTDPEATNVEPPAAETPPTTANTPASPYQDVWDALSSSSPHRQ